MIWQMLWQKKRWEYRLTEKEEEMEGEILLWIQECVRNPFLTPVMKFCSMIGNAGIVWICLALLIFCIPKTRMVGATMFFALFSSLVVNNLILKNIVARVRPYEVVDGLNLIVAKAVDASFPSGHAAASFAAAVVMLRMMPEKYGVPAMVLATMIALSRLYVGIHYPTDVLFGVFSGCVLGYLSTLLCSYHQRNS